MRHHCSIRIRLLVAVLCAGALQARAQSHVTPSYEGQRNQPVDIVLTSDSLYGQPHRDVRVTAVFEGPDQIRIEQDAFWDGGRMYRIRFAPPAAGTWRYRTLCSDKTNAGLHGREGRIDVSAYAGENPFARHGWLEVSGDGRYLTHADGTPFFYLADTAWEIVWRSRRDELVPYLDDRRRKDFNVIQMVSTSHMYLWPWGTRNQDGEPLFLDDDFGKPNPRYFDYMDEVIGAIVARGMTATIVPIWARMTEPHHRPGEHALTLTYEQAAGLARYLGARYAGYPVIWLLGGDVEFARADQQAFWTSLAGELRTASGGRQLLSIHPGGWRGSFDYFGPEATWLDFHTYQSGHIADGTYTFQGAFKGYSQHPPRPVLNGEPVFEDLPEYFWQDLDESAVDSLRMTADDVRKAAYESVLSGSLVGFAYGANGVWQWVNDAYVNLFWPRDGVLGAIALPGAAQMTRFRHVMEAYRWYVLTPQPQRVLATRGEGHVSVAAGDDHLLAYFPETVEGATINLNGLGTAIRYRWLDPATGDSLQVQPIDITDTNRTITVRTPGDGDWLLVAERVPPEPGAAGRPFFVDGVAPHPFRRTTVLHLDLPEPGTVHVSVWDVRGRRVLRVEQAMAAGPVETPLRVPGAGLYVYRVTYVTTAGDRYEGTGTMVSIGD